MATDRRPVSVRCASVQTRKQPVKQQMYFLDVTWSDGQNSRIEVNSSSLAEWRSRFKAQCFDDQKDVIVPELPVCKRLEIKRDEKRKKAMDEFFRQILELPDVQKKNELISELLEPKVATPSEVEDNYAQVSDPPAAAVTDPSILYADLDLAEFQAARREATMSSEKATKNDRRKPAVVYTEVVPTAREKAVTAYAQSVAATSTGSVLDAGGATIRKPTTNNHPEDPLYSEVVTLGDDKGTPLGPCQSDGGPDAATSNCVDSGAAAASTDTTGDASSAVAKKQRPKHADVYTEVVPAPMRNKPTPTAAIDAAGEQTPLPTSSSLDGQKHSKENLYTNVKVKPTKIPTYENFQSKEKAKRPANERQFYVVTESYAPYTSSSQELAVSAGDIVRKELESGDRIFCMLCVKTTTAVPTRRMEGWLPLRILAPCSPEVVEDSDSAVPVVRLDNNNILVGRQDDVTGRCAADDNKEIAPDLHVIASCDADDEDIVVLVTSSSTLPAMPLCRSPTLTTAPQHHPLKTATNEKGGKFGGRLQKLKKGKKKHEATKNGTSGDGSRPAAGAAAAAAAAPVATGMIRVVAVADWPGAEGAMAFRGGDCGELVYASDRGWLCVRVGQLTGWVPADYWKVVTDDGRTGGLTTANAAPWMVGKWSRESCERNMLNSGRERDFVVRSSPHLTGQYAISVRHGDRIHHFPIVPTEDGKYYIGKHHFSTMHNVIIYYSKNTLFNDDNKVPVTLGRPYCMANEYTLS